MDSGWPDCPPVFPWHAGTAWALFDPGFYAAANPAAHSLTDAAELLAHYLAQGAAAGFSPNRWFDEAFYRQTNDDVAELIRLGHLASGFEHYCQTGFATRAPHWLFDPAFYHAQNPSLTEDVLLAAGFANAYDHFLKHGAAEQRPCHPFLDPVAYMDALDPPARPACAALGAFRHFLTQSWRNEAPGLVEPRVSARFDPHWYRAAYPEVAEAIRAGHWHSALHHYLVHRTTGAFQPLPPGSDPAPPRIKLHIDLPRHHDGEALDPIEGPLDIVGWAAATHPVSAVDIYIDGEYAGRARHGRHSEGVAAAFPELTHSRFAGFRFIAPSPPNPGRHRLRIVARGEGGLETAEEFAAVFTAGMAPDGPWSLRRRMPGGEAAFKTRLLAEAGLETEFVILLPEAPASQAARQHTLASLHRQIYRHWRLHDIASPVPAWGWLVPLTPGDELGVDALLELALARRTAPGADFLYTDERRIDPNTGTIEPFFKPNWSPELLLATDYIGRLWAASAELAARAGFTAESLARAANYDAVLRLTEHATAIVHVPIICSESAPRAGPHDEGADDQGQLQQALHRRALDGTVTPGLVPRSWRIRTGSPAPLVSIIIPTAFRRGLIETTLHLLHAHTAYPRIEIILIDTAEAIPPEAKAAARAAADLVIEAFEPCNGSRLNNQAAARATGELLLFLGDDIAAADPLDPSWLRTMVEQVLRPDVGVVGPRLLSPGGMVQHAGIFVTPTGGRAAFAGLATTAPGPFGLALTQRNVAAVSSACLLVRRDLFDELGGFDESSDAPGHAVEFCARCRKAGRRIVYTPFAALTRQTDSTDEALSGPIHHQADATDPFFHPRLSARHADYRPDPEFPDIIYPSRPLAAPEAIRRILVIKLDHIGDFLLSLPAIRRLKAGFPASRVTLLAASNVCELAALEPAIADMIPFEFFHRRSGQGLRDIDADELAALTTRLHAESFDLAVDLRCHHQTRHLLQSSGATWLAGFDAAFEFPWLDIVGIMEPDQDRSAKRTHASSTLLDFAEKIAASFQEQPVTRVLPAGWAIPQDGTLPGGGPQDGRLRIAIHPGAGNTNKQWPAAHFGTLIDLLAQARDCRIVLVGGEDEADIAAAILTEKRRTRCVGSAVGQTDMAQLAALIASCDLFIGNDSGPHHLAACLGIPTIGIHSGVVDAREWSPLGPSAIAVRRRTVCAPCYIASAAECPRDQACLDDLSPTAVFQLAQRYLVNPGSSLQGNHG
jgi:ADP-heptose:LPS heptosyltransferase